MRIRSKALLIFLAVAFTPMALFGLLSYRYGERSIKDRLGAAFSQSAFNTIDKVDRHLFSVEENLRNWTELEFMQELITSDSDGKISSFLIRTGRKYDYFSTIHVLNRENEVVASSNPIWIGAKATPPEETAIRYSEQAKEWVLPFVVPIKPGFLEGESIGTLFAEWKMSELPRIIHQDAASASLASEKPLILDRSGLLIGGPAGMKNDFFQRNLMEAGLASAREAADGRR
ncbi:MAG: cache domain-containing protein, partial [Verrucomicrobiota bacterium]